MLNWLSSNLSTILISLVLLAIVISLILLLLNRRSRESTPAAAAAEVPVPAAPPAAASVTTDSEYLNCKRTGMIPCAVLFSRLFEHTQTDRPGAGAVGAAVALFRFSRFLRP